MSGNPLGAFRRRLVLQLAVVVAAVSLAFIAVSLHLRRVQEETHHLVQESKVRTHEESLSTVVGLRGLTLRNYVADYSLWGDMATFARSPDAAWAATNLDASLATFKLSYVWVFDRAGTPRYHATSGAPLPELPGAEGAVAPMLAGASFIHYFTLLADGTLVEVRGARIQAENDAARESEALGYLFAATRWDPAYVEEFRALTRGAPSIVDAASDCPLRSGDSAIVVGQSLPGRRDVPVARLCVNVPDPMAALLANTEQSRFAASLVFAGALFATLSLLLHLLVARPVRRIAAALATGDTSLLGALETRENELGELARAVVDHRRGVAEREALRAQIYQASKMASLGVLGAGVAHELNNPLAAVLGHADMLVIACQEGTLDLDEVRESATVILAQSERMRAIIDHVRQLNRAESGPPRLVPRPLHEVVCDALSLLRGHLDARKVRLVLRLAPDLPDVACDRVMLESVVQNLVLNAADELENVEEGSPRTIVVETSRDRARGRALVRVSDDGGGIPQAIRDRVFEPFFTTKQVGKGTGLGLALVQGFVDRHGGDVTFTTSPSGTTFVVALPLAREPADQVPHAA